MSEYKFRVGDVVSINVEIAQTSPGQSLSFVRVGTDPYDTATLWVKNSDLTLVRRKLSIGDKVEKAGRFEGDFRTNGEILAIHKDLAWVVWAIGSHETWPLSDLKAI